MSSQYKQDLITAFQMMSIKAFQPGFDGNMEFCKTIIQKLQGFIGRCKVSSTDTGTIGSNKYEGQGKMDDIKTFNDTSEDLYDQINAMDETKDNNDLADYIITNAKSAIEDTVLVMKTTGSQIPPSGPPTPASGTGIAKIQTTTSDAAKQQLAISMSMMTESSTDQDVAEYITQAMKTLLKATITTTYTGEIQGGGSGTMEPQ